MTAAIYRSAPLTCRFLVFYPMQDKVSVNCLNGINRRKVKHFFRTFVVFLENKFFKKRDQGIPFARNALILIKLNQ